MSYMPGSENRDGWAMLGFILATVAGLFAGTTLARRRAERRAAEIEEAEAAAHREGPGADITQTAPQP